MSFFDGFADGPKMDSGMDKGMDTSTTAKQDISKVANQHKKAAEFVIDQLGKNFTKDLYIVQNKKLVQIESGAVGHFFADEIYVVDLKGATHRYQVCWMSQALGQASAEANELMDGLCSHILTNDMSRAVVQCGREPENFLQFFPSGFIIH